MKHINKRSLYKIGDIVRIGQLKSDQFYYNTGKVIEFLHNYMLVKIKHRAGSWSIMYFEFDTVNFNDAEKLKKLIARGLWGVNSCGTTYIIEKIKQ